MITLKQLAEYSGLSIRTVSRILNGFPYVKPEKRELVLRLASEHHYVPNIAARNLRNQDKRFVGILLEHLDHYSAVTMVTLLNSNLSQLGYSTILERIQPGHQEEYIRTLNSWAGAVDYVVVMYVHDIETAQSLIEAANHLSLKLIFVESFVTVDELNLRVDRTTSVAQMIVCLQQRGYRKILHCGYQPSRLDGMMRAAHFPGGELLKLDFLEVFNDDGYSLGDEIVKRKPELVFFDTDRMAVGFYCYANERGIRIPKDIAVVGFDNDPVAELLHPALSTLAHPAKLEAQRICEYITTGKKPPEERLLMRFIERGSIGNL